jgi:hypothetical protein
MTYGHVHVNSAIGGHLLVVSVDEFTLITGVAWTFDVPGAGGGIVMGPDDPLPGMRIDVQNLITAPADAVGADVGPLSGQTWDEVLRYVGDVVDL